MKKPNGTCACCGNPGYTTAGRRIQDINTFRHHGENRVRLYRFRATKNSQAARLVLLVCAYCVKKLLGIQTGKLPVFRDDEPFQPGETVRSRGYWRRRLVQWAKEAEQSDG